MIFDDSAPQASSPLKLELMIDYVTGHLGGTREQATAASIVRLVIAGGALPKVDVPAASLDPRQQAVVARPLRELDVLLTQLAASVPVDLMPGEGDPTNQALPQQPLHPCMFPEAARYAPGTFAACTNPHDFSVGGVDFLGTSGQNISNLCKYTNVRGATSGDGAGAGAGPAGGAKGGGDDGDAGRPDYDLAPEEQLDLMEATLRWQHVAPSAPDTLACYPYKDRDPFFMEGSPHVYFAAGGGVVHVFHTIFYTIHPDRVNTPRTRATTTFIHSLRRQGRRRLIRRSVFFISPSASMFIKNQHVSSISIGFIGRQGV